MKKNLDEKQQVAVLNNAVSREIVQTIMDYGVSQEQILQIINLLALELEDNNLMRSLVGLCKGQKTEKLHV
tara:strand:- start:4915 stop:5127 length:213 start_codon:yes stop_codon:yes gene_type:complete